MEFYAFEPGIEVNGQTVFSIVDGFKFIKQMPEQILLQKNIGKQDKDGNFSIDNEAWYLQQNWLDAFKEIASKVGDPVLFQIGKRIPANAKFPPWVDNINNAIKAIDIAYHMNHRKNGAVMFNPTTGEMLEGIGHYGYQRLEDKNIIISECNNPYPCAFDQGIIETMAKKFQSKVIVMHDNSKPCRKKGADSCTYIVKW